MRAPTRTGENGDRWTPIRDPEGRFSSGIPDLDRLLGAGFRRGSFALVAGDETVLREDFDLLLFPTYLNWLYQSRGIVAILPSNDSPHDFRARLTRFVTRRRFDSRVRVMDYVGEDREAPYVVSFHREDGLAPTQPSPAQRKRAIAKAVAGEKAAQGTGHRPFLELVALEIFETLMGSEAATKTYFRGVKRSRQLGNLALGILGPGLGCAPAMRRMADVEVALHRDDVGLSIRGVHPAFPRHVVTPDIGAGAPRVVFVPPPA
jgi:hypothetical protein